MTIIALTVSLLFVSCGTDTVKFRDVPYDAPYDYEYEYPTPPADQPPDPDDRPRWPEPDIFPPIIIDPPVDPAEPEPDPSFPELLTRDFYYQGNGAVLEKWPYCHVLPEDYWQELESRWWGFVPQPAFCEFYEIVPEVDGCSCKHREKLQED
jgi:hypothetical protein